MVGVKDSRAFKVRGTSKYSCGPFKSYTNPSYPHYDVIVSLFYSIIPI